MSQQNYVNSSEKFGGVKNFVDQSTIFKKGD